MISGGMEFDYGLTDFISTMSQPAWVWTNGLDFPRLYSWSEDARKEILNLLRYRPKTKTIFKGENRGNIFRT